MKLFQMDKKGDFANAVLVKELSADYPMARALKVIEETAGILEIEPNLYKIPENYGYFAQIHEGNLYKFFDDDSAKADFVAFSKLTDAETDKMRTSDVIAAAFYALDNQELAFKLLGEDRAGDLLDLGMTYKFRFMMGDTMADYRSVPPAN